MTTTRFHRSLDRVLIGLLTIGFFYNAYRYPLQINSSGTSPTYSDTPGWLSLGKYVLILFVIGIAVLIRIGNRESIRLRSPIQFMAFLFLALVPIGAGILVGAAGYITIGFFFLVAAVLHLFSGWSANLPRLNRFVARVVYIAIAVEVLQVLLMLTIGRLPALAHEASISIRFGSFLDDPNGYGLLVSWLFPFALAYFTGMKRWAIAGALLVTLALTQSLTALGCFLATAGIIVVLYVLDKPKLILPALVTAIAGGVAIGSVVYANWREIMLVYDLFMYSKEGSIEAHAGALDVLADVRLLNALGIEPWEDSWVETGYVNMLAHFGILYIAVLLIVGIRSLASYLSVVRDPLASADDRAFAYGAIGLLVAFYLGNLNLPVVEVFPINLFAVIVIGMSAAGLHRSRTAGRSASIPVLAPEPVPA